MDIAAHVWTVLPLLRSRSRPPRPLAEEPFVHTLDDPAVGRVRLSGHLRRPPGVDDLLILVHGLGGCADSRYMIETARQADAVGLATLRLNLRGSDRNGDDFYHAGLSADLGSVLGDPALDGFTRVLVLGFSLGGHIVLRFATEVEDRRVRAVAAVCAPLDLSRGQQSLDRGVMWPYRRWVMRGLHEIYARVAARRPLPASAEAVERTWTLRAFDGITVVPRFGFADPDDYYRQASVGPRLGRLRRPALLVAALGDPMVPPDTIRPHLAAASPLLDVRWASRGGHVGFPADLDLGTGGPPGLTPQVLSWLTGQA